MIFVDSYGRSFIRPFVAVEIIHRVTEISSETDIGRFSRFSRTLGTRMFYRSEQNHMRGPDVQNTNLF